MSAGQGEVLQQGEIKPKHRDALNKPRSTLIGSLSEEKSFPSDSEEAPQKQHDSLILLLLTKPIEEKKKKSHSEENEIQDVTR
jgi:hypothetical protein